MESKCDACPQHLGTGPTLPTMHCYVFTWYLAPGTQYILVHWYFDGPLSARKTQLSMLKVYHVTAYRNVPLLMTWRDMTISSAFLYCFFSFFTIQTCFFAFVFSLPPTVVVIRIWGHETGSPSPSPLRYSWNTYIYICVCTVVTLNVTGAAIHMTPQCICAPFHAVHS